MKKILSKIFKKFGYDDSKYNKLILQSNDFVFTSKNKIFLFVKYFIEFLLLFIGIIYLLFFFYIWRIQNEVIVPIQNVNNIIFSNLSATPYGQNAFIYLIFGILNILLMSKVFKIRRNKENKYTKNQIQNHRYSFEYVWWVSVIIIELIRLAIVFSLDNIPFILNPNVISQTININSDKFFYTIFVAFYYTEIIVSFLIVLISFSTFFYRPKIKQEYKIIFYKSYYKK